MRTRLLILMVAFAAIAAPSAQSTSTKAAVDRSSSSQASDLDAFMAQVITRRDDNWKKLQQYVLDEDETFQITGPEGRRLYGSHREYNWFPRDGFFVRSPVKADGVAIAETDRRKAEESWLARERRREERRRTRAADKARGTTEQNDDDDDADVPVDPGSGTATPGVDDLVRSGPEPRFVSSAYFMRFRFDPGHYALAGREKLLGRDVLKIEYYPTKLFQDERSHPTEKKARDEDAEIQRKMNKAAFVTLWVEPNEHQILQYDFRNVDLGFLPARYLVRLDQLQASMRMGQPFPGIWLPDTIAMRFGMTLAIGRVAAQYDVRYHDYRLADVKTRVR